MKKYYDPKNKRLIQIEESATAEFWDNHWSVNNYKESMELKKNNPNILNPLNRFLPHKKGKILEGGCGNGIIVYCMYSNGYDVIGVDFASKTVRKINKAFPELDVRFGNLFHLEFPDSYFTGYWSGGVIEHFWGGYFEIIKEISRVLKDEGYLFISFPYMSPLRRLKAILGIYEKMEKVESEPENFYQFILDSNDVIKNFEKNGFNLLHKESRYGFEGLKKEWELYTKLEWLINYQGNNILIRGYTGIIHRLLNFFSGHSIFMVFKLKKL